MTSTNYSVGDNIEARCTKCQRTTNHIIVAIVAAKPASVECNTCKGTHRYRKPAAPAKAAKTPLDRHEAKQEGLADLRAAINNIAAKDYDMELEYRVGSVMRHPSFGLGLVQRIAGNRKVEVMFESGKKLMRCK